MEFLLKQDPTIKKAHRIYTQFTEDSRLRELSLARQKRLRDEASRLDLALEQGIQQGISQGQYQAKCQTAQLMKQAAFEPEMIAKMTGLTLAEIEKM